MLYGCQDLVLFKPRAHQNLGPFLRGKRLVNEILRGQEQANGSTLFGTINSTNQQKLSINNSQFQHWVNFQINRPTNA